MLHYRLLSIAVHCCPLLSIDDVYWMGWIGRLKMLPLRLQEREGRELLKRDCFLHNLVRGGDGGNAFTRGFQGRGEVGFVEAQQYSPPREGGRDLPSGSHWVVQGTELDRQLMEDVKIPNFKGSLL